MRGKAAYVAMVGLTLLSARGCGPPAVSIHHRFPPAVALGTQVGRLTPGEFQVTGKVDEAVKQSARKALADRIPGYQPPPRGHAAGVGRTVTVTGRVHIEVADTTGNRLVRRWGEGGTVSKPTTVPILRRHIRVRTVFDLAAQRPPTSLGSIEVRRQYDSATDTRVRGELGLGRPDDPDHVPPAATVVAELMAECVQSLHSMLRPVEYRVEGKLRSVSGSATGEGFAAMRNGEYANAGTHFAEALKANPDSPAAHFNRAVAAELAGDADTAVTHYEKVLALAPDDAEARDGLRRARRLQWFARQAASKTNKPRRSE